MAIQLNGIHSENYERTVAQQERAFNAAEAQREADMTPAEKAAEYKESHPVYVTDNHVVATSMIPEHKNFDVDTSIYNGLSANPKNKRLRPTLRSRLRPRWYCPRVQWRGEASSRATNGWAKALRLPRTRIQGNLRWVKSFMITQTVITYI